MPVPVTGSFLLVTVVPSGFWVMVVPSGFVVMMVPSGFVTTEFPLEEPPPLEPPPEEGGITGSLLSSTYPQTLQVCFWSPSVVSVGGVTVSQSP